LFCRLYEKIRDAHFQNVQQKSGQDNSIDSRISEIFKLLESPDMIECALDFLQKMAPQENVASQLYINLATNATLECVNSRLKDISTLSKLDEIVKPYLNVEKDPEKIYKLRKASLKIAEALLTYKLPHEAKKWMQRIIMLSMPNASPILESESMLFEPQIDSLSLLTFNLPRKPSKLLQALNAFSKDELDILNKLIDQLPLSESTDIVIRLSSSERSILVNHAKKCLEHTHPIIKRLGFELTALCAAVSNDSGTFVIDTKLLHELINYLPLILSASKPNLRDKILIRMKSLLLMSPYAEHAEGYMSTISAAPSEMKPLYQANCKALAFTKHLPLCLVGKNLLGQESIDKYSQNLKLQDKVEITLQFINALLPENVLLALECIKMLANDCNATEIKKIYISILNALIDGNYGKEASEQLVHCKNRKILLYKEKETTELWLKWLEKFSHETFFGPGRGAEHWLNLLKEDALSKNHFPDKQIDLLTALIVKLYHLKAQSSDVLANKLIMHLNSFKLNDVQKTNLLEIIETSLRAKLTKETLHTGYQELKNKSGCLLTEQSQLTLRKSFLEASIKYENYALAIEILTLLQNQAGEEFVTNAFEMLLKRLFQFTHNADIEEDKLNQCYRLLTNIDLKSMHAAKFHYALKLLTAMNKNSSVCIDENCNLLRMNLKILENGFSEEGPIIEFLDHLLNFLKTQTIPNDIKNSIISCHPIIAQRLQKVTNLDKYREYFRALNHHQILLKIPNAQSQIIWITYEYMKQCLDDPAILLEIHKLLDASLQVPSSQEIETNITSLLATALLTRKLIDPAKVWIDYTIAQAGHKKLISDLYLVAWCKVLINLDRPHLCLTILEALKKIKSRSSITAELYLQVSIALFEKNKELSVQLLLDNSDLMKKKLR